MRLFLSSQGITPHAEALLRLVGANRKTAFINNAKDDIDPAERAAHTQQKLVDYTAYGLEPFELDLRNYFTDNSRLIDVLKGVGLVWLSGGNTFILRRALAQSGLDKWLVANLKNDTVAYGGSSAGAIIPTPSLHGTEHGDEPNSVPAGYSSDIIWEGLNLVPFYVIPHYDSDWFGGDAAAMERHMKNEQLTYNLLRDGEAIVVNGDETELLK